MKNYILLFLKGIAMGSADVVPGVSGGTIAFITGIYENLLQSIRSVNGEAFKLLLGFRIKELWERVNGAFLLPLLAGIATAIILLARIVLYVLENYPELLWAFFFGLIIASALLVGKQVARWNAASVLSLLAGAAVAYYITVTVPVATPTASWFIFLSGALAICAMILPGISGSFILLLLGKYEFIIGAVKNYDFKVIIVFALGCVTGILSFSHLLNWMLRKYHSFTIALLTGFMLGSLNKVWPWKKVLQTYTSSKGEVKPLIESNVLPWHYQEVSGNDPQLMLAIGLTIVGFAVVYAIEKLAGSNNEA